MLAEAECSCRDSRWGSDCGCITGEALRTAAGEMALTRAARNLKCTVELRARDRCWWGRGPSGQGQG